MIPGDLFHELDWERIHRLRDVASDIGQTYMKLSAGNNVTAQQRSLALIAGTYYRRAAAHSQLMNDRVAAQNLFSSAAMAYEKGHMTYSVIMRSLAESDADDLPWARDEHSPQMIYGMISNLRHGERAIEYLKALRVHVEEHRALRLGLLAIPVQHHIDLFDALLDTVIQRRGARRRLMLALSVFVSAYSSAFLRARRDTYHWTRLAMPFHPAEPDIVGLLTISTHVARQGDVSIREILSGIPAESDPLAVLKSLLPSDGTQADVSQDE